jgi:hypothetical protein
MIEMQSLFTSAGRRLLTYLVMMPPNTERLLKITTSELWQSNVMP